MSETSEELRELSRDESLSPRVRATLSVAADEMEWLERWYWLPPSVAAGVLILAVGVLTWLWC